MPRGVEHDPELRARAIAALLTGSGVDSVARDLGLPEATVKSWKKIADRIRAGDEPVQPQKEKKQDYGAGVSRFLEEALVTLAEQQKYFRNPEWLKRQPAAAIAVLHGVSADKVIRILEAAERSRERSQ